MISRNPIACIKLKLFNVFLIFLSLFPLPVFCTNNQSIIINEVLPSPEGPDSENEYVEIFNKSDVEIDLSGWSLKDTEGKSKTFSIPAGTIIYAKGFLVFFRPKTKITLNNTGDGLMLFNVSGELIDQVYYEKSPEGKSFTKLENDWFWNSILTPGKENSPPRTEALPKTNIPEKENLTQSPKENSIQPEKPDLEQRGALERAFKFSSQGAFSENSFGKNFSYVFLTSLGYALFFSIFFVILKKKFL